MKIRFYNPDTGQAYIEKNLENIEAVLSTTENFSLYGDIFTIPTPYYGKDGVFYDITHELLNIPLVPVTVPLTLPDTFRT